VKAPLQAVDTQGDPTARAVDVGQIENLDPGIKPLVHIFNEVKFFETFWSCQGHSTKDRKSGQFAHARGCGAPGLLRSLTGIRGVHTLALIIDRVIDALSADDGSCRFHIMATLTDAHPVYPEEVAFALDLGTDDDVVTEDDLAILTDAFARVVHALPSAMRRPYSFPREPREATVA
jgi:hypothetical protein